MGRRVSACTMSLCEGFASSRRHQHVKRSEGSTGSRLYGHEHVGHADAVDELAIRMEMERRIAIYLDRPRRTLPIYLGSLRRPFNST